MAGTRYPTLSSTPNSPNTHECENPKISSTENTHQFNVAAIAHLGRIFRFWKMVIIAGDLKDAKIR